MLINILITIGTFIFMEGVAWFTHKFIMHGFLWILHEDHHDVRPGVLEKNDAFFLIFATPSIILFFLGAANGFDFRFFIGLGIAIYGAAYFFVHDLVIHQRISVFKRSKNLYIMAIRKAHKVHHKHLGKHDGECFGMLYVPFKYFKDAAKMKQNMKPA